MCNLSGYFDPLRAPEGVGLVSLREVVEALEHYGDRYWSVACFADDVAEVLALARRQLPTPMPLVPLQQANPGMFGFLIGKPEDDLRYSFYLRKPGIAEVFRGPALSRFTDLTPYASLCVQKAERLKEGKVTNVFAVLKRTARSNNACFCLYRTKDDWECFSHDFVRWVKRNLWPEPVEPEDAHGAR